MFKRIIQEKLDKDLNFQNELKNFINEPNFLDDLGNWLCSNKISNEDQMKSEIDRIFHLISSRFRLLVEQINNKSEISRKIFYKIFQEYKRDGLKEMDKNLKELQLKTNISVERSKYNNKNFIFKHFSNTSAKYWKTKTKDQS